jgi:hypothetical protein
MTKRAKLPRQLRIELLQMALRHRKQYAVLRGDSSAIAAAARFYASNLKPKKKVGRKKDATVSAAYRLLKKLARMHPDWTREKVWQQVYLSVIPNYSNLSALERKEARQSLRLKVNDRKKYERRIGRKAKTEIVPNGKTLPRILPVSKGPDIGAV